MDQCLTPKVIYEATVVNNKDNEKGYTLVLQTQPLRSDIVSIHEILVMNATLNVQSYRSTFGSLKETKKSLALNGKLLEKSFVMQKAITVYCV